MGQKRAGVITVGVCTLNRRESLLRTLDQLLAQASPEKVEFLVVDNGSDDGTVQELQRLAAQDDRLHYFVETRRGQSYARNLLIARARGDVIAFTDDDLICGPGWLHAITTPLRERPEVAATGGRVDLVFPRRRPAWLDDFHASYLAERNYGASSRPMVHPESPVGASMAIRTQLLRDCGGFSTVLGHVGRYPVGCEEYELFLRLRGGGHSFFYVAAPAVGHQIPSERMTRRYMAFRMFCTGVGRGTMRILDGGPLGSRELTREILRTVRSLLISQKRAVAREVWRVKSLQPLLVEYFRWCFEIGRIVGLVRSVHGSSWTTIARNRSSSAEASS